MAIDLEVIFTGLCLFCLDVPGSMCEGKAPGFVYLVDGTEDQRVCDRVLDGGHRPRIAFNEKFLLPGSTRSYSVEPAANGSRTVVASLEGIELCIRTEPSPGTSPTLSATGATPIDENLRPGQKKPMAFLDDADSFEWVVDLRRMHPEGRALCPQVFDPLDRNKLITARVRLDQGIVKTTDHWHDSYGDPWGRRWRRMWALDYHVWATDPVGQQTHFPRALPGKASWVVESIPDSAVVLLEDCQRDTQQVPTDRRTLFRLRPRAVDGSALKLHVTNTPDKKSGAPGHAHLEHFRWYYRLIDWYGHGCPNLNEAGCPSQLPLPVPPPAQGTLQQHAIKSVITETIKCPPGSGGSG